MIIDPVMRAAIRQAQGVAVGPLGEYPAYAHDWEFNPNVSIYGFLDLLTGWVRHFSNLPGLCLSFADLRAWWPTVATEALFIGFNSAGVDNHGLRAILSGEDDPAVLYNLGQTVIAANQGIFLRHPCYKVDDEAAIDLMAIGRKQGKANSDDSGLGSLKEVGIKIGYPMLRTLPYPVGSLLSFEQAAVVCQGLLQYLAVAFPQRVWDAFGSWLRTIRPGIPPSELVVASALRHGLPEFLLNPAAGNIFAKFVIERQDTDKMQAFRLAS